MRIIFSVFLILFTASCSSVSIPYIYEPESDSSYDPVMSSSNLEVSKTVQQPTVIRTAQRMPWEAWPFGRDLRGDALTNINMIQGDEYLKQDVRSKALELYKAASKEKLTSREDESLALRISSVELSMDKPANALATLSAYFKKSGRSVSDVDEYFSLLFAYAYGRNGNVEQSIAWFSRVNRLSAGRGGMSESASSGLRALLHSLSDDEFNSLDVAWNSDSFVSGQVGQERRRRAHKLYEGQNEAAAGPFWMAGMSQDTGRVVRPSVPMDSSQVGVLVPLSGKFASLGKSALNGIELAAKAQSSDMPISLESRDTGGSSATAAASMRELITVNNVNMFLGPLLSEPALEASGMAAQTGSTMIAFSKRQSFPTGRGVFRLGPTMQSQINSLLKTAYKDLGMIRFGVLYPQSEQGIQAAELFRAAVQGLGLDLVFDVAYHPGDTTAFTQVGEQLAQSDVEGIFFPDSIRAASALMINMPPEAKRRVRLLGPASWDNSTQLTRSKTILERSIFVSPFFMQSQRPIVQQFMQSYEYTYKKKPDFLAAQGFDAATMLFAAIRRQQSEGISVQSGFSAIETYDGLTGKISVNQSGDTTRNFAVVEVTPRGLSEVEPLTSPSFTMRGNAEVPSMAQAGQNVSSGTH